MKGSWSSVAGGMEDGERGREEGEGRGRGRGKRSLTQTSCSNGWFHPECCGLVLSPEQVESIHKYSFTCPLCIKKEKKMLRKKRRHKSRKEVEDNEDEDEEEMDFGEDEEDDDDEEGGRRKRKRRKRRRRKSEKTRSLRDDGSLSDERDDFEDIGDPMDEDDFMEDDYPKKKNGGNANHLRRVADTKETYQGANEYAAEILVDKIIGMKYDNGVEVYLVKWRHISYLHVTWEREIDIIRRDPQGKMKIRRFSEKMIESLGLQWKKIIRDEQKENLLDEEYFSPSFIEIERIIACSDETFNKNIGSTFTMEELEVCIFFRLST